MSRFHGPQSGNKVERHNGNNGPKGVLRAWKAARSARLAKQSAEGRLKLAKQSAVSLRQPHEWVAHPLGNLEIICAKESCHAVWKPNKPRPPETKCPQAAKASNVTMHGPPRNPKRASESRKM